MRKIRLSGCWLLFVIIIDLFIWSCKNTEKTPFTYFPVLSATKPVKILTDTTAQSGGIISNDWGLPIIARGVCRSSTSPMPTIDADTCDTALGGNNNFTVILTGLNPSVEYTLRAYAINRLGVGYAPSVTFKTRKPGLPTLSAPLLEGLLTDSVAYIWSHVIGQGQDSVVERGVCWSVNPNPTITDFRIADNLKGVLTKGVGSYDIGIKPLIKKMKYYVRSYATNRIGTGYSTQISFTTPDTGAIAVPAQ